MSVGYPWTAWVLLVGGALLALSGLTLLIWSLFWDRSKGRPRCPRCWYDMSAATGLVCSECGGAAKHEGQLHKTRRRWRLALVGLLLFIGASGVAWRETRNFDWNTVK